MKVMPIVFEGTSLARVLQGGDGKDPKGLLLPIPPVLTRAMKPLAGQWSLLLAGGGSRGMTEALDRALLVHPEGMLYMSRGITMVNQRNWVEAEASFRQAAATPSLLPVRRPALYAAAVSAFRTARPEVVPRGRDYTRQLMALGPLRPDQAELLVPLLQAAGEPELANLILRDQRPATTKATNHE
jgi:hypothetical protein